VHKNCTYFEGLKRSNSWPQCA